MAGRALAVSNGDELAKLVMRLGEALGLGEGLGLAEGLGLGEGLGDPTGAEFCCAWIVRAAGPPTNSNAMPSATK